VRWFFGFFGPAGAYITAPKAYKDFMHDKAIQEWNRKQESEKRARKQLQKPTPALLPQSPSLCTRRTSAATNRKTENITSSPRVFKSEIFLIQVIKNSRGGAGPWGHPVGHPRGNSALPATLLSDARDVAQIVCESTRTTID